MWWDLWAIALLLGISGVLSLLIDDRIKERRRLHAEALEMGYHRWILSQMASKNVGDDQLLAASEIYYEALDEQLERTLKGRGARRSFAANSLKRASEDLAMNLIECEALLKGGGRWVLPARSSAAVANLEVVLSCLEVRTEAGTALDNFASIDLLLAELFLRVEAIEEGRLRQTARRHLNRAKVAQEQLKRLVTQIDQRSFDRLGDFLRQIARRANGMGPVPEIRATSALVGHPDLFFRTPSFALA